MTQPAVIASSPTAPGLLPVSGSHARTRGRVYLGTLTCIALSLLMHLPWLGCTPIAGTEGHRIFPAHEMVRSGQWLAPMLFGKPFLTKPPLHHWLIAVSEAAGGGGHAFDVASPRALFLWRLPSAVCGAMLCGALFFFAARWFGPTAGWISGLGAAGMVAIWGQSQVADIDATNTLASVLAALCGVQMLIIDGPRRFQWSIAAALAMAAMWMTKGPAGIPIVLGVWLFAVVLRLRDWGRERNGNQPMSLVAAGRWAVLWLVPLLVGPAAFYLWWVCAGAALVRNGYAPDLRGVREGADKAFAHSPAAVLMSLIAMLPQVIAFGLPVTAAAVLFLRQDVRRAMAPAPRRIAWALLGATLISWVICVGSGMTNPRYAYPTLMLLCPLAGAACVAAARVSAGTRWVGAIATFSAIALAAIAVVMSVGAWADRPLRGLLLVSTIFALVAACGTIAAMRRSLHGAGWLVAVALFASIPFGAQRHWARTTRDSGINTAQALQDIVGRNGVIAVAGAATSKPETFYYAHLQVNSIPLVSFVPTDVPRGTWMMFDQAEHRVWHRQPHSTLEHEQKICRWGQTDYYIGWYPLAQPTVKP